VSNRHKLNTKASGIIALAVMCSRVLGLVREILFNSLFGAELMGIFRIAFRAPNLLRDLFAEGALSTAFITVFSKKIEREGDAAAWDLAAKMFTLTTVFMSIVTLIGIVFAKNLIGILAWGFAPKDAAVTVWLTQIMFPFILLVSLAALVMGMLNSKNVFGVPAMASSFFNIGSIAGGALLGWWIDPHFGERALAGLAVGTLIGGAFQLFIQFPSLRRAGFRFRLDFRWNDPGVKTILTLMVPSVIAASAVQVNVLVNSSFASTLGKAPVSWLDSAFRLMQLPIGIFGVAVATITLPVVSRIAADVDRSLFGPTLGKALRLATFLTLPSAVGLWFLGRAIMFDIYGHGKFSAYDTAQSALALQFYAMGLVAYSGIKVLSPAFYAINRKWTPMLVSFASIALNVFLNWLFVFRLGFGHRGLALSTALSATLNFVTLYALMVPAAGTLDTPRLLTTLARCGVAAAVLGAICWAAVTWLHGWLFETAFLVRVGALFAVIAVAGGAYFGMCLLLRVEATQDALSAILRKLRRHAA
jgi:putative peptidoglycan lipid II flippase